MKVIIVVVCLVLVAVNAASLKEQENEFHAFKLKHHKSYKNQVEEITRFAIFKDNLRAIEEHNVLYEQGLTSYKKGVNRFTDTTPEEFKAWLRLSGPKPHFNTTRHENTGLAIPDSVDWREGGQVTGIKDQRTCGSCWAFATAASTEAAYKRSSGKLVSFSAQQLVDCTTDINNGCKGGYLDATFPYVRENGLQSEESYPYRGSDGNCQYNADKVVTKITSFKAFRSEDEASIQDAVGNIGPVGVCLDANNLSLYESGIFEGSLCSPYDLNHAVTLVGYGSEDGKKFWIVKNSWGEDWGEKGYFRIARGKNECGIAEDAAYPIV